MKTNERIAQLHALSKVYAKAKAESEYLNHFRKSKLAILKAEYSVKFPENANCKNEDLARANPEYLAVLDGLKAAIETAESCYWELNISRAGIVIWQTQQADRRAELQSLKDET